MLTDQQKACNFDSMRHIERVRNLLNSIINNLLERGEKHDQSKLQSPEVELFTEFTPRLAETTFGSPQYEECKMSMRTALDHHYANNSHHPEHYKNGVDDMNILDIVEMLIDWKAASERHNNGNLRKSIEINAKRFDMNPQLARILENSISLLT